MKALDGLSWRTAWVTHMSCIQGCTDYLGINLSSAWLYGGTGHAFVLNLHEGICPSGPTAWKSEMLFRLGRNLGYAIDGVFAKKEAPDFAEAQRLAWDHVRAAIDEGVPCYGWELDIPEYYVIYGYTDEGYHFKGPGCEGGKGPAPWQALGDTGIGVLEAYSVRSGEASDDATVVRQALAFAIEIAGSPAKWINPLYAAGLKGYDNWIRALERGGGNTMGQAYNASVWHECRQHATDFLQEAALRLAETDNPAFQDAIARYGQVATELKKVSQTYPFWKNNSDDPLPVDDRSRASVAALRRARDAEAAGLDALGHILEEL